MRRIKTTVAQAAPVLANLRNLALAEFRANNDSLTGLPNKRATDDTLKRMVAQANRSIAPAGALMLDLDHFKQINDRFGHGKGDEVLAAVGAALPSCLRASDFAGRFGGEEFLILLPDTAVDGALQVAEKIRARIAAHQRPGRRARDHRQPRGRRTARTRRQRHRPDERSRPGAVRGQGSGSQPRHRASVLDPDPARSAEPTAASRPRATAAASRACRQSRHRRCPSDLPGLRLPA